MANGRNTAEIKRIRNEILVALRVIYPAALQARHILHSLLVLFPTLEMDHLRRDLHYLMEKGYIGRVPADTESDAATTPWRRRWYRLTSTGMEVADRCTRDPALEQ
jgi:hypothetical protein